METQVLVQDTVYSYLAAYDLAGNVEGYTDSVMGEWAFGYDALNRLMSATPGTGVPSGYAGMNLCMNYDAYGNRTQSNWQTAACNPASDPATATYNTANQVTWTTVNSAVNGFAYDAAGNVTNDAANQYLYDGEGRVCAVQTRPISGGAPMFGYIYDAEGRRVAKGTLSTFSCNLATNGFTLTESYVLGQDGEQLTTLDQNQNWQRTNAYGGGKLLATYDAQGLHFHLTDPLGTRRVQTNDAGVAEEDCQGLPFGDGLNCYEPSNAPPTADDSTPLHFTGKERDADSGNDYFGARYYASSMGRFMSPDWSAKEEPVPYAKLDDPQSLNLYAYVQNNPLSSVDNDGHFTLCRSPLAGSPTPCAGESDTQANQSDQQPWWQKGKKQSGGGFLRKALSYFYIKGGNGSGFGISQVKLGPVEVNAVERFNGKDVKQTTDGKTVTTINSKVGVEGGIGPVQVGVERTNSQEEGQAPKITWVPGIKTGEFEGSGSEIGLGVGGCLLMCGQVEVGVQGDKVWNDLKNYVSDPTPPPLPQPPGLPQ